MRYETDSYYYVYEGDREGGTPPYAIVLIY